MKKFCLIFMLLFVKFQIPLAGGVFPDFFGAKSLALGMGARSFNFSTNSMYLNPSLMGGFAGSITGYQFMNSSRSVDDFGENLENLLTGNFKNFDQLNSADKSAIILNVKNILSARTGFWGFSGHFPGVILGNYGISTSIYESAIINPIANENFDKSDSQIGQKDIDSLRFQVYGFSFKNYSFSYAIALSSQIQIGATFSYINGKYREFKRSIGSDFFSESKKRSDYLSESWANPDKELQCINIDVGVSVDMGKYFKFGAMMKNANTPNLVKTREDFKLERIIFLGFAFKPEVSWEISADLQVNKSKVFMSEHERQPVSVGIEKGFFKNKMFVRLGFLSYINDEYLVGAESNMIMTVGTGFNVGNFIFNFGAGFDKGGMLNSLAVSGFILVQ